MAVKYPQPTPAIPSAIAKNSMAFRLATTGLRGTAPTALDRAHRPSPDRFSTREPPQLNGQFARR